MEFDKAKYSTDIGNLKELAMRIKSIIADIYEAVAPSEIKTRVGTDRMVMSDVEIIVIAVLGELMTIDSDGHGTLSAAKIYTISFRRSVNAAGSIDYGEICMQ